jgi:hypothetical protein
MTTNINPISSSSPADSPTAVKENTGLNRAEILRYFAMSNAVSALFNGSHGIVTSAAQPHIMAAADGTPDVEAVSTVTDSLPANSVQADLQAAGWMAFIDRMYANMPDASGTAQRMLNFAYKKLMALSQSTLLDQDFKTMVGNALVALGTKAQWTAFWILGTTTAPGPIKTLDTNLSAWLGSATMRAEMTGIGKTDDDTMFSIIMLFNDLGAQSGAASISGLANAVFGWNATGEQAPAYAEYARFVAYYLWENMCSGAIAKDDLNNIVKFMDAGADKTKFPYLYDFFHGDGSTAGLSTIIATIVAQADPTKWPRQYGIPSQIERWARKDWADCVNA